VSTDERAPERFVEEGPEAALSERALGSKLALD
jgi:hypothetical protein